MPGGRPTIYTDENLAKAAKYLVEWEGTGDVIPSQAGLAIYLGISLSCVEKWARDEKKQEFLRVLDQIEVKQQALLVNKGLSGDFNSNIAKLVLGKHGFKDKAESEITGKDGGPIELSDIERAKRLAFIVAQATERKNKE
jgi:hypothetical protein